MHVKCLLKLLNKLPSSRYPTQSSNGINEVEVDPSIICISRLASVTWVDSLRWGNARQFEPCPTTASLTATTPPRKRRRAPAHPLPHPLAPGT